MSKNTGILQINTRGSWAHVCNVDLDGHHHEGLAAAAGVVRYLGAKAKFRVVLKDGRTVICPSDATQALIQFLTEQGAIRE